MKQTAFLLLFFGFSLAIQAQRKPDQAYQKIKLASPVQYKNFYLSSLFIELPEVKAWLKKDTVFKKVLLEKNQSIAESIKNCGANASCFAEALRFTPTELDQISDQLQKRYTKENVLGKLLYQHLIPSGTYQFYDKGNDAEFLAQAWLQDARAINHTIGVYIEGKKPNYPKIDSISFDQNNNSFAELARTSAQLSTLSSTVFVEPSLKFALEALEMNGRTDAADFEPMESGVNLMAIKRIKNIDWKAFPYSVILVPGEGPEDKDTELSAGGMLRCRLAAIQYKKGLAPFIVVSGARVHPYKTKYSEAFEMKKFLMAQLHIPEEAIIMEPHARHTTTNLRNCVRLMFNYGMPMDKPAITSTIKSQSDYITGILKARCMKELGYFPFENGKRLSETEAEFYPNTMSLQIDFDEPLDP